MANTTSVGNLSLNITAQITRALNAVDKLTVSLGKANQQLVLMGLQTGKIGTVATQPVKKLNDELGKTKKQADANTKALQTMSGTLSKVGQVFAYQIGFGSLQQSINTLKNIGIASFKEAIDFVENYNLFNVSFGGEVQEALKFQNQLNQAFAVNMSESLRYQGFFKNLTTSLGITNDASALLSENLTKLTYDLSSLYNVQFVDMYTKLQSGMIGQTKPLRSVGIDVTQQTLQPYLYDMGINKKVTELTQAEKVLLRYIAILKQSSTAHGDFARTINTPANQLKILRDQVAELGRWFGTVFMGILGGILPYINGFVIALKEVFKAIAIFFGFNLNDYNFLGDQELPDYEGELNGATQASEELKKSLMGFDEINNMSSQSSSGNQPYLTGGYSETYTKLLAELEGYDNLMGDVNLKAREIANTILDWLGFTKQINGEMEAFSWNLLDMHPILLGIFGGIAIQGALSFAHAIGGIGTAIGGVVGFIDKVLFSLAKFSAGWTGALGIVSKSTLGMIATASALVVAVTVGVVAIIAGIREFYSESTIFRISVMEAMQGAIDIWNKFYETVKPYIDILLRSFIGLWEFGIKPLWEGFVKFIGSVAYLATEIFVSLTPALTLLAELFGHLLGAISLAMPVINAIAVLILQALGGAFKYVGDLIMWVSDLIRGLRTGWSDAWNGMYNTFTGIFSGIGNFFRNALQPIVDSINWIISKSNEILKTNFSEIKLPPLVPDPKPKPKPTGSSGGSGGNAYSPNISMYASGGMPSVGEMFIARESGAELVGNIGSRSAVMNNDQIVQAVSQGVAQAVASVMNSDGSTTVNLVVNDDVFGRAIIKSANRTMKNTNLVLDI